MATYVAPAGSGRLAGRPAARRSADCRRTPPADRPAAPRAPPGQAGSGHRGLTTRGRCLLAGGLAACLCGVVLDERDLLRVGLLAALLPLLAWAITATRRTVTDRRPLRHPGAAEPGRDRLGRPWSSPTRAPAGPGPIELLEPGTPDLSTGTHCLIPALAGGRAAVSHYQLTAQRRGRFVLGPPQVRLGDPFGTWEDNRTLPVVSEVLVVPTVVALQGSPTSGGSLSAPSGRAAQGNVGGDPDVGVRQYQRGDDIRTVHWRATARHDDLMVRLTEPVSHGGATVLLDHRSGAHSGSGADSSLEIAVSLAASVTLHLLGDDHHVRLIAQNGRQLAGGHDIADDVLASLALVEGDPSTFVDPRAAASNGLLIAVLGRLDERTTSLLIAGRRRSSDGGGPAAGHRRLGRGDPVLRPGPDADGRGLAGRDGGPRGRPRPGVAAGLRGRRRLPRAGPVNVHPAARVPGTPARACGQNSVVSWSEPMSAPTLARPPAGSTPRERAGREPVTPKPFASALGALSVLAGSVALSPILDGAEWVAPMVQIIGLVWLIGLGCRLLRVPAPVTVLAQAAGIVVTLTAVFTSGGYGGLIPNARAVREAARPAHRRVGPDRAEHGARARVPGARRS